MSGRGRAWAYLGVFAACAAAALFAVGLGHLLIDSRRCRVSGYGDDRFLAYCYSKFYGDYEHGALYYGSEPVVFDNIRQAQVIFLGNSKTQAGFSSRAVRTYFHDRGIRYFVLGFGYEEWSPFALAVLKSSGAAPKVLVINADPFFSEKLSQPAREALAGGPSYRWRLRLKMLFQRLHRGVCAIAPGICPDSAPSIFRSAADGQWFWVGPMVPDTSLPLDRSRQRRLAPAELAAATEIGGRFLDAIRLDRRCVILTGIPSSDLDAPAVAAALAAALETRSILPPDDGLSTLDHIHLGVAGAEAWSGRFLEAISPILRDCLAQQ